MKTVKIVTVSQSLSDFEAALPTVGGYVVHRSDATATGLSLKAGTPVASAADLPDCRLELHLFNGSDAASAFVDGLALAKRNDLQWTWEHGSEDVNRAVIVALFSEPSAESTLGSGLPISVVEHNGRRFDSEAHKASMERIHRDRQEREVLADAWFARFRNKLNEIGWKAERRGADWFTVAVDTPTGISHVMVSEREGRFEANVSINVRGEDLHGFEDKCAELAAGIGALFEPGDWEFKLTAGSFDELVEAIGRTPAAIAEIYRHRVEVFHQRFMDSMKMTAARRRFLEAARSTGIHVYYQRASLQARAGDEVIKASEYARLKAAGWIAEDTTGGSGRRRVVVTEAGLLAAGIQPGEPEPFQAAPRLR